MNRMNLPCPFDPAFPLQENDVFNSFIIFILENSVYEGKQEQNHPSSSSENDTELESDSEATKSTIIPERKLLSQKKPIKRKKLLIPAGPIPSKTSKVTASIDEVFEKVDREVPAKKIEVTTQLSFDIFSSVSLIRSILGENSYRNSSDRG